MVGFSPTLIYAQIRPYKLGSASSQLDPQLEWIMSSITEIKTYIMPPSQGIIIWVWVDITGEIYIFSGLNKLNKDMNEDPATYPICDLLIQAS